ncbi:MAG: hypothetical protein CMD08_03490 [Flavobacteriales bacterium]|nr:hypothetical protein [Flavobacteriales bacterium]
MLSLILKQTNWSIIGAVFGFVIGFFIKIYIIDIVGLADWGKYVIAQTFSSFSETVLSIGIPFVIIKFIPGFVENNISKASRLSSIFLKYALLAGGFFITIIYFSSDLVNQYVYNDISGLDWILFVMCIHVPISMLFGVVISLYRSVLRIKEIVIYGTLISVTLRAILTLIIFQFFDNIVHFIYVEIFTQILVLFILLYLFNKSEFSLFVKSNFKEVINDDILVDYGKKMFFNSIIAFISGWALSFIISITLSSEDVGAYNILLSLAGLMTFLLINLNKVFAPAISKLYQESNFLELNRLYKKTTFFINILTIPLAIIIVIFADEILELYTNDMLNYREYLFFMLIGGVFSLAAGSSGTFMVMAGLEKKNLFIQIIRASMIIILSLFLIPLYGMRSVVILYVSFMFLVNAIQLLYIYRFIKISPFSRELILLLLITVFGMYFAVNQEYNFGILHFIFIPIIVYLLYFGLMFNSVRRLIRELR